MSRLLFESRLRALSSTLFFHDAANDRGELEWDNRIGNLTLLAEQSGGTFTLIE